MRTTLSWIVGIITWCGLMWLMHQLGERIGVLLSDPDLSYMIGGDRYMDSEESDVTDFGVVTTILCLLIAARVGMAIRARHWLGDMGSRENIKFVGWLGYISGLGILFALTSLASRNFDGSLSGKVFFAIKLAGVISGFWIMNLWRDKRLTQVDAEDSARLKRYLEDSKKSSEE